MKYLLKLILFLIYTIAVFFVKNYILLATIGIFNILLLLALKISPKLAINNILSVGIFILFTVSINIMFGDFSGAILIGIRLILVCNMTYIFKYVLSPIQLADSIELLLLPLRIFKINTKDISLMINIAIAFIPILSDEFLQIKYALNAKGISFRNVHIIRNLQLVLKPLIISIFKRTSQIEYALKAKGYN